jgi:hypothetical protein
MLKGIAKLQIISVVTQTSSDSYCQMIGLDDSLGGQSQVTSNLVLN